MTTKKRPYAQPNAQRRSIYTDAETWAMLLELGNGNASAGIREAVSQATIKTEQDRLTGGRLSLVDGLPTPQL